MTRGSGLECCPGKGDCAGGREGWTRAQVLTVASEGVLPDDSTGLVLYVVDRRPGWLRTEPSVHRHPRRLAPCYRR